MMVALLLYAYCQGERSSRVIEKRCMRDVGYRVIRGGLRPDHATIARFRARHEQALGGLFSQVLRLLAAEGMVSLGLLSLDGTKLAGNAAQKANRTLPQIDKLEYTRPPCAGTARTCRGQGVSLDRCGSDSASRTVPGISAETPNGKACTNRFCGNALSCREAGEPAPTAHDSELGVLCAAHDRSAQRLTRTESAVWRVP